MALYIGLFLAVSIRYWHWPTQDFWGLVPHMHFLFLAAIIILFIVGLYDLGRTKIAREFFQKVTLCAVLWAFVGVIYFYLNSATAVTPKSILLLTPPFLWFLSGFGAKRSQRKVGKKYEHRNRIKTEQRGARPIKRVRAFFFLRGN